MKLITWNVNSIKVRLDRLLALLARHQPDVVCLQEIKTVEEKFPFEALRAAGYHAAVNGQAAYNGVAILSRAPLSEVMHGFADVHFDGHARLISAVACNVRIVCVYVPNGQSVDSEKYTYKLNWLARLRTFLKDFYDPTESLVLCGDINIAPRRQDVAQPDRWDQTVLYHPEMRRQFALLLEGGLIDVFAKQHPEGGIYSWWDYRRLEFAKNNGLRIDHILTSTTVAQRCIDTSIDRDERKGAQPSDHAPVLASFAQ